MSQDDEQENADKTVMSSDTPSEPTPELPKDAEETMLSASQQGVPKPAEIEETIMAGGEAASPEKEDAEGTIALDSGEPPPSGPGPDVESGPGDKGQKRTWVIVAVVAGVVLLICCCIVVATAYAYSQGVLEGML